MPRSVPADEATAAALIAIGASHQGVYELDFRTDTLQLSAEAAALIGFTRGTSQAIPHAAWIARVHAEDRDIYKDALYDYRAHPGLAFRIEFRVRSESGRYPWFELRATMMGEGEQADRCLGLMADVTTRKEAEAAVIDRTMRDPLTGLGNRVALMEELERIDRHGQDAAFAILDIDRFKAIHASLGDAGADAVLRHVADRLTKHFEGKAEIFRFGGDAFALLVANAAAARCARRRTRRILRGAVCRERPQDLCAGQCRHRYRPRCRGAAGSVAQRRTGAESGQAAGRRMRAHLFGRVGGEWHRVMRSRWKPICAARSKRARSTSSTSRSSAWRTAPWPASRPCCAGTIPNAALSGRPISSAIPKRPA